MHVLFFHGTIDVTKFGYYHSFYACTMLNVIVNMLVVQMLCSFRWPTIIISLLPFSIVAIFCLPPSFNTFQFLTHRHDKKIKTWFSQHYIECHVIHLCNSISSKATMKLVLRWTRFLARFLFFFFSKIPQNFFKVK